LIRSLAQPGGNLTGFVTAAPETTAKRGEIIKEMFFRRQSAQLFCGTRPPLIPGLKPKH